MRLPVRLVFALLLIAVAACGTRVEKDSAATPALPAGAVLPEVRDATADDVLHAVATPGARVTLVNIWATWCGPCREEFPDIVKLKQDYAERGLRVIFVSADFEDQREAARRFLAHYGVRDTTFLKTGDDMAFINALKREWTGALPATLVYDASGRLRDFWEGRADYRTFERRVQHVLDHPNPEEKRS